MIFNSLVSLTKSDSFLIGPIAQIFGTIMDVIYNFLAGIGIETLGISIIVFTLVVRTLMLPLAFKQQKSMKEMAKIQPELKKIQDKYKDKKDQESQQKYQMEMSQLYQEHGVNPFGGCLPLLIQFPIIMALFQVLRNIPAYISKVNVLFNGIAENIYKVDGVAAYLAEKAPTLQVKDFDINNLNHVIDVIGKFSSAQWAEFTNAFTSLANVVGPNLDRINEIYMFLGINLADKPDLMSIGVLLPILNVGIQLLVMKTSGTSGADNPTQKSMMYTMPLVTGFFVATMPAGLGLYWFASSLFQYAQQVVINRHLHDQDKKK